MLTIASVIANIMLYQEGGKTREQREQAEGSQLITKKLLFQGATDQTNANKVLVPKVLYNKKEHRHTLPLSKHTIHLSNYSR